MAKHNHQGKVFGYSLVIIGLLFLLNSFDIWEFHWSQIMIVVGVFFYAGAFASSDKGPVFPGTIVLLIGLFFQLRELRILDDSMYYMWPVFLIITGAAFLLLFIFRPTDWGLLIPGGILITLGLLFFAYNYEVIDLDPGWLISRYWPLVLVAVGAKMLIDSRRRRGQTDVDDQSVEKEPGND